MRRAWCLTGPDGLLKLFTKNVLETALDQEMTEHLGHEKNTAEPGNATGNVRNGARAKTVHDRGHRCKSASRCPGTGTGRSSRRSSRSGSGGWRGR